VTTVTCAEHLLLVYRAYVVRTGERVDFLERVMSCPAGFAQLSVDERRNEPATYAALFSNECRSFVEELYQKAMRMMRGRPLGDCDEALKGLVFLQEVAATALWRHRCPVGNTLEAFAREFDRLDVPAERERLHACAQKA
jgi:hypothetical protein